MADATITINSKEYEIAGPVRLADVAITPNPVLFGDVDVAGDNQFMSQFRQSSNTAGSGIYKANVRTDFERHWKSRLETRYRGYLALPPKVVDMSVPGGVTGYQLDQSISFSNVQFFFFGPYVYLWGEHGAGWSSVDATLVGNVTDVIVYNNTLYAAYDTNYSSRSVAGVWTTPGPAVPAYYWAEWDNRLWKLSKASGTWELHHAADGATWIADAIYRGASVPHGMTVFQDAQGNSVLILLTNEGIWIHDDSNNRWLKSNYQIPPMPPTEYAKAQLFNKDGRLYTNTGGLGMVAIQPGNPITITSIGLDLDDAVPEEERGYWSAICADHNFMFGLLDSTVLQGETEFVNTSWNIWQPGFKRRVGYISLRAYQGGWHCPWESSVSGTPGDVLVVSSAYGKRRLYWGANSTVYYMDISPDIYNPRNNPDAHFQDGPLEHITPWLYFESEIQLKQLGHFFLYTSGCSATETAKVYYGVELDDSTWTQISNTAGVSTIITNGLHEFRIPDRTSRQVRFVRFKIVLDRGSDDSLTPIVEFWASEYLRLFPAQYGYVVDVLLSRPIAGRTPEQQLKELLELVDPAIVTANVPFIWRDESATTGRTHYGRVTKLTGAEEPGADLRGQGAVTVSFMVPYQVDVQ